MIEILTQKIGTDVPVSAWLVDPLSEDVKTSLRRLARAPDVSRLAVMPDVHLGADVCIGVVLATSTLLYPQAVGGDIGCGVSCVRTSLTRPEVLGKERSVLAALQHAAPILKRAKPAANMLESVGACSTTFTATFWKQAAIEFGTLGRGNHFLEVQADQEDRIWLCVHSGSRCAGQQVATQAMSRGVRAGGGLKYLDAAGDEGQEYLHAADWCVRYARANRMVMLQSATSHIQSVLEIPVEVLETLDTAHNCVTRETHDGQDLLVHRKGASTARLKEPVVIPGSMGTLTVHAEGQGCSRSLCSSSHGAGRVLSRTEARARITQRDVLRETEGVTFDHRLLASLVEEAPSAYRDIRRVMRAQGELVKSVRTLRTIVCHKGA